MTLREDRPGDTRIVAYVIGALSAVLSGTVIVRGVAPSGADGLCRVGCSHVAHVAVP